MKSFFSIITIPCQVLIKGQNEARTVTVESNKVKEESLKVAPGKKCWRKTFLKTMKITGELLFLFLLKLRLATLNCF